MGLTKRKNLITAAVVICIAVMVVIIAFAYSGTTDEIDDLVFVLYHRDKQCVCVSEGQCAEA